MAHVRDILTHNGITYPLKPRQHDDTEQFQRHRLGEIAYLVRATLYDEDEHRPPEFYRLGAGICEPVDLR